MRGNIFDARKKAQKQAAKRKADGAPVIKSPRTQHNENKARALLFSHQEKQRREEAARRQDAQWREEAARSQQLHKEQRRAAAAGSGTDEPKEVPAQRNPPSRVVRRPLAPAPTAPESPLPHPLFVPVPTWASLSPLVTATPSVSVDELKRLVRANIDTAVLCAPFPGGRIRTWSELKPPAKDSPFAADWVSWLSPAKWADIPRDRKLDNRQYLNVVSAAGNYNEVLEVSAATPVTNSSVWPPQLRALGVEITGDTSVHAVLPKADYVLRMTRMDPFPGSGDALPTYRSMKVDALVNELTLALQAASQGIGPPIYAAVAWPWDRLPGDVEQKYGMLIIMRKADGNMVDWALKLRQMPQYQPGPMDGPSPALKHTVEEAASFLIGLCFHIGSTQHINYDMKKGNILVHEVGGQFYMADFDAMYYRYIPPELAGVKACFFVNLLLLAMHVRAYSENPSISNALLDVWTPILVELWDEALRSPDAFGAGRRWLKQSKLEVDKGFGSFDHRLLARTDPGEQIGKQLTMMVFEYLFDTDNQHRPPPVQAWDHWVRPTSDYFNTERKAYPLVPQLLRFACLNQRGWPAHLNPVFDATVEAAYMDVKEGSDGEAYAP